VKRLVIAMIASTLLLFGCMATRTTTGGFMPGVERVAPGEKILVMKVEDSPEIRKGQAAGSGKAITAALRDSLIQHGYPAVMSEQSSLKVALIDAGGQQCAYVLRGELTEWVDRATEWSGRPDLTSLSVELYSAKNGSLVGSVTHSVAGGDSARAPQRFVPELADHSLGKLFGWVPTVTISY